MCDCCGSLDSLPLTIWRPVSPASSRWNVSTKFVRPRTSVTSLAGRFLFLSKGLPFSADMLKDRGGGRESAQAGEVNVARFGE